MRRSYQNRSSYLSLKAIQGRETLDRFAEALSIDGSIQKASAAAGVGTPRGYQIFARIRRELGPQAC